MTSQTLTHDGFRSLKESIEHIDADPVRLLSNDRQYASIERLASIEKDSYVILDFCTACCHAAEDLCGRGESAAANKYVALAVNGMKGLEGHAFVDLKESVDLFGLKIAKQMDLLGHTDETRALLTTLRAADQMWIEKGVQARVSSYHLPRPPE